MEEHRVVLYKKVKEELDQHGPGMCLAKWSQTTIHLGSGHTHSCHHPATHKIPVEEILIDASALHNTSYKKEKRKEMMNGFRPSECQYCWNVEDKMHIGDNDVYSDRVYKSAEPWSRTLRSKIEEVSWEKNINPSYLEISFNSTCNFKCSYCSPDVSSKWMEEIVAFGPYPTSRNFNSLEHINKSNSNKMPIPERDDNPYVDAFWKWWPDLYPELSTFRITGGEPLLTKHTFKVLDYIIANPNLKLDLAINSNLVIPDSLFQEFIQKIKIILDKRLVKSVQLFTSCEAYDIQAEYIRHGMNYKTWIDNLYEFTRECPDALIGLMCTYNALSVITFERLLQDMLELKKFRRELGIPHYKFIIDIPYLRYPQHQGIKILTPDFLPYIESQVNFMEQNLIDYSSRELLGFENSEFEKMKRVYFLFKSQIENQENVDQERKDFFIFVNEHDRRRNTNFLQTFPEFKNFYNICAEL
jgi:organic radical activating enzyme